MAYDLGRMVESYRRHAEMGDRDDFDKIAAEILQRKKKA